MKCLLRRVLGELVEGMHLGEEGPTERDYLQA